MTTLVKMEKKSGHDLRLAFPCTIQIAGYSMSGKSTLAGSIVKNRKRIFKEKVDRVYWLYGEWQPLYENLQTEDANIIFTKENNDILDALESGERFMCVIDDRTLETLSNNTDILSFFIQKSHHKEAVFLWLTHAIFLPKCRLIQINASYCIVLKMLRDSSSILRLGYQLCPTNPKFIYEAYQYSVNKKPYAHILFLFHPSDAPGTRIRTSIFFWERDFEIIRPKDGSCNQGF